MKSVTIPWGCWRGNRSLPLTLPQNWKVSVAAMADGPDVGRAEIRRAFANPIGQETGDQVHQGQQAQKKAGKKRHKPGLRLMKRPKAELETPEAG